MSKSQKSQDTVRIAVAIGPLVRNVEVLDSRLEGLLVENGILQGDGNFVVLPVVAHIKRPGERAVILTDALFCEHGVALSDQLAENFVGFRDTLSRRLSERVGRL